MTIWQKIIIGTITGLLWLGAIVAKHFWPDTSSDIAVFTWTCAAVIGALGVHGMASKSATAQAGFARVSMMAFIAVIAGLTLMLGGCATSVPITSSNNPLGAFTLQDARGASTLAQQRGDAAGQKCYDYIASAIEAASAVPFTPGLLYLNELRRTAASATAGLASACGGVLPIAVGL